MVGYADLIIGLLEPKVGKAMATSVVKMVCKKQGIDISNINRDHLNTIADGLFNPLKVFAGDEFAQKMVKDIKNIK